MSEMISMEIFTPRHEESNKKPFSREFLWYDNFYGKMIKFQCSALSYERVKEEYINLADGSKLPYSEATKEQKEEFDIQSDFRLFPIPVYHDIIVRESVGTKDSLQKVIDNFNNYSNSEVIKISEDDKSFIVSVDADYIDDIIFDLDRNRFEYGVL